MEKHVFGMENYKGDMNMAETVEAVETVKADAPKEVTPETMAARLKELQKNHETISE